MDLNFIFEFWPMYAEACILTLIFGLIGVFLSIIIGFIISMIQFYKIPVLNFISKAYVELSRNTPLLVQLFLLYFGLPKVGIVLSSESCAIFGLAFLGSSYMSESIRAGLESISKSQIESAEALGFKRPQVMKYIILPQAISVSVPAITANIIFLIKETSVFSAVTIADLMYVAKDLIGLYYKTDEALLLLVLSYLVILLPISILSSLLERRLRYAGFGN